MSKRAAAYLIAITAVFGLISLSYYCGSSSISSTAGLEHHPQPGELSGKMGNYTIRTVYIEGVEDIDAERCAHIDPIVRTEQEWPIFEARSGDYLIQLTFSVDAQGYVVIDSLQVLPEEYRQLFTRVAARTLRKWKYSPKIVAGKAVARPCVTTELKYKWGR